MGDTDVGGAFYLGKQKARAGRHDNGGMAEELKANVVLFASTVLN